MTATYTHPGAVLAGLEAINTDLAEVQNEYEEAAADRARLVREWELRLARCMIVAEGSSAEKRKGAALIAAVGMDGLYERLMDAEGRFEGCRARVKVLETRSMIGLGILRSQGRS